MSAAFDPYFKWLAIPPEEQPANHYRLLGVPLFLDDPDVIENAADQRMSHVRNFGTGQYSELSQKILNEISRAKVTLLNPQQKVAYDAQLRKELHSTQKTERESSPQSEQERASRPRLKTRRAEPLKSTTPLRSQTATRSEATKTAAPVKVRTHEPSVSARVAQRQAKPVWQQPVMLVAAAAMILAIAGVGYVILSSEDTPEIAETGDDGPQIPPVDAGTPIDEKGAISTRSVKPPVISEQPVVRPPVVASAEDDEDEPKVNDPPLTEPPIGTPTAGKDSNPPEEEHSDTTPSSAFLLRFAEDDFVELTGSHGAVDLAAPFTAEAWVRLMPIEGNHVIVGDHCWGKPHPDDPERGAAGWALQVRCRQGKFQLGIQYATGPGSATHSLEDLPDPGDQWHHIALCSTAESARVYFDGKLSKIHPALSGKLRGSFSSLYLGAPEYASSHFRFDGEMRAFRLSDGVRYQGDFAPLATFAQDSQTRVLLDFSQGKGTEVPDIAGNHPGRISGAQWVATVAPAVEEEPPLPAIATSENEKANEKQAIPEAAELEAKRKLIEELYGDRIRAARTQPQKWELAEQLLADGRGTEKDSAGRYALFEEARRLAVEAGDVELAIEALEAVAEEFDVDPWSIKAETLAATARAIKDGARREQLVHLAVQLTDGAIHADQFDAAETLVDVASSGLPRSGEVELRKAVNSLRGKVRKTKVRWEKAQAAAETLKQQPDDADAHLALGIYLALDKRDWQGGLANLARGSDAPLAKLAQEDLASPQDVEARLELADSWYNWARRADEEGGFARSLHWYQSVLPDVTALQATKVNKRIDELTEKVKPIQVGVGPLPWIRGDVGLIRTFPGQSDALDELDISLDGRYAVAGSPNNTFRVCDLATGEEKRIQASTPAHPVCFTPDVNYFLGRANWGGMRLINWKSGEKKQVYKPGGQPIAWDLLPDKPIAVIVCNDSTIVGWNYASGQTEFRFTAPDGVAGIALAPDGRQVLLGRSEGRVCIYDLVRGRVARELEGHPDAVRVVAGVAVSPDGRFGLSVAPGGPGRVWDFRSGQLLLTLRTNWPMSGDFSPDSRRVVVAGQQATMFVWDLRTKAVIHRLTVSGIHNSYAKFTPDGRGIVAADRTTGVISLYRISDPD